MKIYCVTAYDNAHSWHFVGSKKEADAKAREIRAAFREEWPEGTVEIEAVEVTPTRAGIAQALQDFVDQTCINEH